MDFRRLEYFIAIAQLGSLTKASEYLNISEPSLSRQVRLLEDELKGALFIRTGRGVKLTQAGDVFFQQALGIMESVKRAQSAFADFNDGSVGKVSVGLPPRIARVVAVPLIEAFRKQMPQASISIVEGLSNNLMEWLQVGRIELAVLYNPGNLPSLKVETLCTEELVFVGHASMLDKSRGKLVELVTNPMILPMMPHVIRTSIEAACHRQEVEPNVVIEADTADAILDLVRRKLGFSILPRELIDTTGADKELAICAIESPRIVHSLALTSSRSFPSTQLGLRTRDLIHAIDVPQLLKRRQS